MEEMELKPQKKEEVENLVSNEGAKITEEKIEESLNYDSLTDAEKRQLMILIVKLISTIQHKYYNMELKRKAKFHNFQIAF